MDVGIYELVDGILRAVIFMAVGGCLALIFFVIFAQSILGSKTTHVKLDKLLKQIEKVNELLEKIAHNLKKQNERND